MNGEQVTDRKEGAVAYFKTLSRHSLEKCQPQQSESVLKFKLLTTQIQVNIVPLHQPVRLVCLRPIAGLVLQLLVCIRNKWNEDKWGMQNRKAWIWKLCLFHCSILHPFLLVLILTHYFHIHHWTLNFHRTQFETKSKEQNPAWKANSCYTSQEISCFSWNPTVPHVYHMSHPFHPSSSNHHNNIRWRLQIMKLSAG
jgi:hypothetical protein